MKFKKIIYGILLIAFAQFLTGCVPFVVGAVGGAAGGYVYSQNYSSPN
ncbi:MAG: hypothetical protein K0R66_280 [Gammaproteobacteria bacterium]|jgi:hypothetical protein|nr:hypothetical protein [Gammaproteobacteria bacterium]